MSEEPDTRLRDKDGRVWEDDDLQHMLLQIRSIKKLSLRLGLQESQVRKELKSRNILNPTALMKEQAEIDPVAFRDSIIREGSISKAAKYYGVSETQLKETMDELKINWRKKQPTEVELVDALDKFGSVLLAARILGTTTSEIKKLLPEWRDYRDPLRSGRHAISTGRIGEDYWASIRSTETLVEFSRENPNYPDYDFLDMEYGKVNVKTANPTKQKKKEIWAWTWEVKASQLADVFPLVFLDRNRFPQGYHLVVRDETGLKFPPGLRVSLWSNGCYGVSMKAPTDRPGRNNESA
jgi:hypothetical protein